MSLAPCGLIQRREAGLNGLAPHKAPCMEPFQRCGQILTIFCGMHSVGEMLCQPVPVLVSFSLGPAAFRTVSRPGGIVEAQLVIPMPLLFGKKDEFSLARFALASNINIELRWSTSRLNWVCWNGCARNAVVTAQEVNLPQRRRNPCHARPTAVSRMLDKVLKIGGINLRRISKREIPLLQALHL